MLKSVPAPIRRPVANARRVSGLSATEYSLVDYHDRFKLAMVLLLSADCGGQDSGPGKLTLIDFNQDTVRPQIYLNATAMQ